MTTEASSVVTAPEVTSSVVTAPEVTSSSLEVTSRSIEASRWSVTSSYSCSSFSIFLLLASNWVKLTLVVPPFFAQTCVVHRKGCATPTWVTLGGFVCKLDWREIADIPATSISFGTEDYFFLNFLFLVNIPSAAVSASSSWRPGSGSWSISRSTPGLFVKSPLVFKVLQLLTNLKVSCVELSFQMHGKSLVCIACWLKSTADFANLHYSILLACSLIESSFNFSLLLPQLFHFRHNGFSFFNLLLLSELLCLLVKGLNLKLHLFDLLIQALLLLLIDLRLPKEFLVNSATLDRAVFRTSQTPFDFEVYLSDLLCEFLDELILVLAFIILSVFIV